MLRNYAAAALVLGLSACQGRYLGPSGITGGVQRTRISVRLAGAPMRGVQSATIWVSRIYLLGNDAAATEYTVTRTPAAYELLGIADSATPAIGDVLVPVDANPELRLVIDSARLTLAPPVTFATGVSSRTVRVAATAPAGVPVRFPVNISLTGVRTTIRVVVDPTRSFTLVGVTANPTGLLFAPVMNGIADSLAASLSGTTLPVAARAKLSAVINGDTLATALADTLTGAYVMRHLAPGSYTIGALGTGLSAQKTVVLPGARDTTGINFP